MLEPKHTPNLSRVPSKPREKGDPLQSQAEMMEALRKVLSSANEPTERDDVDEVVQWARDLLHDSNHMLDGKMVSGQKRDTDEKIAADALSLARFVRMAIKAGDAAAAARLGVRLGVKFAEGAGIEQTYGRKIAAHRNLRNGGREPNEEETLLWLDEANRLTKEADAGTGKFSSEAIWKKVAKTFGIPKHDTVRKRLVNNCRGRLHERLIPKPR